MSTQVASVGGDLLLKGIRHLSNHESVLCVLHVDEGDFIPDINENTTHKIEDSANPKRKVSSGKSVHFNFDESDSCERSSTSSSNYSEGSIDSECKMPALSGNGDKSWSGSPHGLSPRVTRKKKSSMKPSPLLNDTTEKTGDNSPKMSKKSSSESLSSLGKSVDKLGLSPRIRRKGSARAPSADELSTVSSKSEKKHSWPLSGGDYTQAPLHSGFIGSEEELEKLKFIKNALSPLPAPISPEQFRKRSSTFGEESTRQKSASNIRERSSTLDNNKKEVYSKYNKLTMKVQEANKPRKPRYGSAH